MAESLQEFFDARVPAATDVVFECVVGDSELS